jgi:hypothetical protein
MSSDDYLPPSAPVLIMSSTTMATRSSTALANSSARTHVPDMKDKRTQYGVEEPHPTNPMEDRYPGRDDKEDLRTQTALDPPIRGLAALPMATP